MLSTKIYKISHRILVASVHEEYIYKNEFCISKDEFYFDEITKRKSV